MKVELSPDGWKQVPWEEDNNFRLFSLACHLSLSIYIYIYIHSKYIHRLSPICETTAVQCSLYIEARRVPIHPHVHAQGQRAVGESGVRRDWYHEKFGD